MLSYIEKMTFGPKISKAQYRFFASAFKAVSEGIMLGVSAAFFLPEVFQLKESILIGRYLLILFSGLLLLILGAILEKRGER